MRVALSKTGTGTGRRGVLMFTSYSSSNEIERRIILVNRRKEIVLSPSKQEKLTSDSYLHILHSGQLFLLNAVKLLLVGQVDGGHLVILRSV